MAALTEELLDAYHATTYQFEVNRKSIAFRAGDVSPEVNRLVAKLNASQWAFISAGNPYSQLLPAHENQQRHLLLIAFLKMFGYRFFEGRGIPDSTDWPSEASLFILGISLEKAVALGQVFDQHAIVFCPPNGLPQIVNC